MFPHRHELSALEIARQYPLHPYPQHLAWVLETKAPEPPLGEPWQFADMRSLISLLNEQEFLLLSKARQLLWWQSVQRFCSRCGAPLEDSLKERAKVCKSCDLTVYPTIAPAVIVAVMRGSEILLAHNSHFTGNRHSIIAGFVEPGETLEQAVAREVHEEVGITVDSIEYVESQPWSFPNSLMLGFTARYAGGELKPDGIEIDIAGWFTAHNLPEIPPPGSISRRLIDLSLARA